MTVLLQLLVAWLVLVLIGRFVVVPLLSRGPGHDPVTGLMWIALRLLALGIHRARAGGFESLRRDTRPGPLIVVSNHTGAIDPLLIQSACRFEIRWMMAQDLMYPALGGLWRRQQVIAVSRDGSDRASAREAIRHLRDGGVIGIFPEGRIVTPPRQVWPFFAGVGLIVSRTRAPVLLVWVSGTPETNVVSKSIFTPSRARVRFVELLEFTQGEDASTITETLRRRLHEISGWPLNDHPPPPPTTVALEQLEVG
ncbi:MAG: lysophospholipid acyltransferase family protein [Planctomycetota bacterium]